MIPKSLRLHQLRRVGSFSVMLWSELQLGVVEDLEKERRAFFPDQRVCRFAAICFRASEERTPAFSLCDGILIPVR